MRSKEQDADGMKDGVAKYKVAEIKCNDTRFCKKDRVFQLCQSKNSCAQAVVGPYNMTEASANEQ